MTVKKSNSLFGTDGIRGLANEYPMTSEVALALGRALAYHFKGGNRNRRILIGKDTRRSGYMIEMALASGITSMGADVLLVGPMPSAGVAFLTQGMRAEAGVMVSASHNSFHDNGMKVFDHSGFKLEDGEERKLESLMFSDLLAHGKPSPERVGRAFRLEEARGRYIEFLKGTFPKNRTLDGLKIVVDCAHGASYQIAPTVFDELGADLVPIGVKPDGLNINESGAMKPEGLRKKAIETGAHLGIALDGDADRVVVVDEKGNVIDGDALIAVLGAELLERGLLKDNVVVGTVMSNLGLENYLTRHGGKLVRTKVGDRYIVEAMRQSGYLFGGESSGHLIFKQYSTTGDGVLAALQVLALMQEKQKSLSELLADYSSCPQVMKNVPVRERREIETIPSLMKKIHAAEQDLGHDGRLLVRYSGTEPLVRIMIEGWDAKRIESMAQDLAKSVAKELS